MNEIKNQRSIAGLRANAAAFLINLCFFIPGIGAIISIVSLILEQENEFVRKYAKQTLSLSVIAYISLALNLFVVLGTVVWGIFLAILTIFQIIAIVYSALGKEFNIPKLDKITNLLFVD